jgi:hypothetical protein
MGHRLESLERGMAGPSARSAQSKIAPLGRACVSPLNLSGKPAKGKRPRPTIFFKLVRHSTGYAVAVKGINTRRL